MKGIKIPKEKGDVFMKKLIKTVAAVLAVIMMFGSISAFAFNVGEVIEWGETGCYGEIQGYRPCVYEGTLTEGENALSRNGLLCCREFYAEKDGYYSIEYNRNEIGWFDVSEKTENGVPIDDREMFESQTTDEQTLVYLEKGTHFVSYLLLDGTETAVMKIEYQNVKISDIKFEEGTFDDLVLGADVWYSEGSGEPNYGMNIGATVVFTNGKEYDLNHAKFVLGTDGYLENGENEVTVGIFDYTEPKILTLYTVDYLIEDIEIENLDKYLNSVKYYDGSYDSVFEDGIDGKVTVKFNDGTAVTWKEIKSNATVPFPNGRFYTLWVIEDSYSEEGKVKLGFEIAEEYFSIGECKVREATFAENSEKLEKYILLQLDRIKYYFSDFLEAVEDGRVNTVEELFSWILSLSRTISEHGGYALEEIKVFCDYYI